MRLMLDERPWYQLTIHFFRGLFDFGILSDAGSDAFRRILIGIVAVVVTFGLLLTRMYLGKYAALSEKYHDWGAGYLLNREPYHLAVLGDGAFVIAFPMLIVGFVVVVASNSLFPDEIDCRVLLPLPVSRRVVFASKALAVMLFASIFAIGAHVAMMPLVVLMWNTRWSDRGLLAQLIVHGFASLGASIVTALVIMAVAGALLIVMPRSRLQMASIAFRGASLCGLVLSVPLVCRLPMTGALIASGSRLFYVVPPVWFLGIQQVLLGKGTPYFVRLAQIAAAAAIVSFAVAVGSYISLYKRFERVIFRPRRARERVPRRTRFLRSLRRQEPATAAIAPFIHATLMRSPLHLSVFVIIAACGAGVVLNRFMSDWHARALSDADDPLIATVIWAPFALVFAMNVALRAALVLPIELRANWIFRVTEDEATRAEELGTVVRMLILLGIVLPLAMLFPVEWAVLGPRAVHCTSIAGLCGLVLVELHMAEWRRIPFTCSYEPSRQFVGQTLLIGVAAFVVFTTIGSRVVWYSIGHPLGWLAVMTILGAVLLALRRQRLWFSGQATLVFEDVVPNEVEPLRLSEY